MSKPPITEEIAESSLRAAGLDHFGFVGAAALREACSGMPDEPFARLGLEGAGCAVVAALPYGEGPSGAAGGPEPLGPLARLARFARADWYAELGARLKDAASRMRARLAQSGVDPGQAREWRRFANSRLPERRLALDAGLGRLGRHGLVMLPGHGSAVVLGVLLCPIETEAAAGPRGGPRGGPCDGPCDGLDPSCAGCRSCADACPTGALASGGFVRALCLQHWSSIPGPLPPAIETAWGDRLYGCDICQEACPRFRPDASAVTGRGLLGPGLPARWVATAPAEEIRAALRHSALGMGWISVDALKRNALLALR